MSLPEFLASLDTRSPREEFYDVGALARLGDADRRAAEDELVSRARAGDPRAALTLGVASVAHALPALEQLAGGGGDVGAFARRAVLLLRKDDAAAQAVAGDLASPAMILRFAALDALGKHGGAVARRAFVRALDDVDPLVRREASEQLLEVLGLRALTLRPDGEAEPLAPLENLCWLMSADLAALHQHGAAELRRIADALDAGQTPASLDLVYRPGPDASFRLELSDVLADDDAPIPLDRIRAAGAHEGLFAQRVLSLRLQPSVRDPRAPGALIALGAEWVRPAIAEAAAGLPATDRFAAACLATLRS